MKELSAVARQNLVDVFDERNPIKRSRAINALWADFCQFRTIDGTFIGHEDVGKHVGDLLRRYPEFTFFATSEGDEVDGAALMQWAFGGAGQQPGYTGTDLIVFEGDRITLVCRFLHGPVW